MLIGNEGLRFLEVLDFKALMTSFRFHELHKANGIVLKLDRIASRRAFF